MTTAMTSARALEKDPSYRFIIPAVLLLHFAAAFWLVHYSTEVPPPPVPKKMVVATVILNPKVNPKPPVAAPKEEPPAPPVATSPEPLPEPAPIDTVKPEPSKPEPAPPEQKQIEPKPIEKAPPKRAEPKAKENAPKESPKKETPKKAVPQNKPIKKAAKPEPSPKPANPKPVKPEPAKPKPRPPAAKSTPTPQKAPPSIQKESPPAPQKPNAQEVAINTKRNALLSLAKEKIGKIDLNSGKLVAGSTSNSTATPSRIDTLSIDKLSIDTDSTLNIKEMAYKDELRVRLKLLLKLPEYGDVKLKLTLNRSGKVMDLKMLSSASSANKEYIEKNLPKQNLPAFGVNFPGVETYTFTITMSNE